MFEFQKYYGCGITLADIYGLLPYVAQWGEYGMSDAFQSWLASKECYELLLNCSGQVISRARKKAMNLEAIFQVVFEIYRTEIRAERIGQ